MSHKRSVGWSWRSGGAAWAVAVVLPASLRTRVAATAVVAALVLAGSANGQCVPTILGSVDTPVSASGVAVSGAVAYVADAGSGLQVIDVSDPASPVILGSVDTPDEALGVAVSGTVAYVADGFASGLQVIDVSDPGSPVIVGSIDTPGNPLGVAVSGAVAYVADDESGLQVIDVSSCSTRACCINDGCLEISRAECEAVSGTYLGTGTTCATEKCPVTCASDLDGSGAVDFGDILRILTDWGPCPK